MRQFSISLTEIILILSGILLLSGLFVVWNGGSFAVWTIAKVLYGLGVLFFLFKA